VWIVKNGDRAWLAGLFEGEGCFTIERNGAIRAMIAMSDQDVIERVHALFPGQYRVDRLKNPRHKDRHWWRISGPPVIEFITLVRPWLGERRQARADELVASFSARLPHYQTRKTHCVNGHPLSGDNLMHRSESYNYRRCRICTQAAWTLSNVKRRVTATRSGRSPRATQDGQGWLPGMSTPDGPSSVLGPYSASRRDTSATRTRHRTPRNRVISCDVVTSRKASSVALSGHRGRAANWLASFHK
jgi:hypothetical protein